MAATPDITALLVAAQSPDANTRTQAEKQLEVFKEADTRGYLIALATELANNDKPVDARRLAGLILKNNLDAKEAARKGELKKQWLGTDAEFRTQIKNALLSTLHAKEPEVAHTAAMDLAKVAGIEVPAGQWPDLIPVLQANMANADAALKVATLESLGFVCEELGNEADEMPQEHVNQVLTAVVAGMAKEQTDVQIKLAATKALYNALDFARVNFNSENERNYLMQVICEGAVNPSVPIQQASFECLVRIAGTYYETLPKYIPDLYNITVQAAQHGDEQVALQAIEFWCTIADTEMDIQEELEEAGDTADSAGLVCHKFIQQAAPTLVPVLLELLKRQEEGQDEDDTLWNISMAAGTALGLLAQAIEDAIVELVVPFVQENISVAANPEDWRRREAATFAFGSIVDGPSVEKLVALVTSGLEFLLKAMSDPSSQVKTTTAWTIGRIFEYLHGCPGQPIIVDAAVPMIVEVLIRSLQDEVHIAEKVAYAISRLSSGYGALGAAQTTPMSQFYMTILGTLLETTKRPCPEGSKLHVAAFEAINDMIRSAASDTMELVGKLIDEMLERLAQTANQPVNTAELREKQSELQGHLCGVLQVIVTKLSETEASAAFLQTKADRIMEGLLFVLQTRAQPGAGLEGGVHEEALMAVGAMTYVCGNGFCKYLDRFYPFLQQALSNHADFQVCAAAVGVLGDVASACEAAIASYCDNIMQTLLQNLQLAEVRRSIKPGILGAFGSVALAIGDHFERYLAPVVTALGEAMKISYEQSQSGADDVLDYNTELRLGIFEACTGLLQGLVSHRDKLAAFTPSMLDFVSIVAADKERDASVTKYAVAALGDIAMCMPGASQEIANRPHVVALVTEARSSTNATLRSVGEFASEAVQKDLPAR